MTGQRVAGVRIRRVSAEEAASWEASGGKPVAQLAGDLAWLRSHVSSEVLASRAPRAQSAPSPNALELLTIAEVARRLGRSRSWVVTYISCQGRTPERVAEILEQRQQRQQRQRQKAPKQKAARLQRATRPRPPRWLTKRFGVQEIAEMLGDPVADRLPPECALSRDELAALAREQLDRMPHDRRRNNLIGEVSLDVARALCGGRSPAWVLARIAWPLKLAEVQALAERERERRAAMGGVIE